MREPIGIFDSGLGGISILIEIRKLLPAENLLYFADSAFCPYGTKPLLEVRDRMLRLTNYLVSRQVKALIVACNSACTAGLDEIRREFPSLPVIGVEPAVKPASSSTKNRKIGILSTQLTLEGERYANLADKYGNGMEIFKKPAPGLVELVEKGQIHGREAEDLVRQYVDPLLEKGIDTLVLGCTHYPFLRPIIQRRCGPGVTVIDTGLAVAKRTMDVLKERNLLADSTHSGKITIHTSGDPLLAEKAIKELCPERCDCSVTQINI